MDYVILCLLSRFNSLTRKEKICSTPLPLSVVSCCIWIGDGEGSVECALLVDVAHMESPAEDAASHS